MEQGLYAKVVKLRQKYLNFVSAENHKNESKFEFQGLSARSQRWFDLEFDWIEVKFSTREPDLYEKKFHIHDNTQDTNTFKIFQVPIRNSYCVEIFKFQNDAPILKYWRKSLNSSCFSSLVSVFVRIKQIKADNSISLRTYYSLKSKVGNHIDFANAILKTNKIKGEPRVYYSLRKNKKMCPYYNLTDISEHFTLV